MEKPVQKYLLTLAAVNLAANLLINGVLAWLLNHAEAEVTLSGIAIDLAITTSVLTWIVSFLATDGARKSVRAGSAPRTAWQRASHPLLRQLPTSNALRALLLAGVATLVLAGVVCGVLALLGIGGMQPWPYIVFKAIYTGVLAAGVAWVSGLAALGEPLSA